MRQSGGYTHCPLRYRSWVSLRSSLWLYPFDAVHHAMGRPRGGRVIAVKNEGIHKHRTNSIMSTIMPPQPRCSYRNSLYIRSKQARRNRTCTCTYVRHRKQVSIYCARCKVRRSGFLFVRCVRFGLLAVPHRSITFLSHSFGRLCMVQAGRARSLGESIDNTELASGTCSY